MNQTMTMRDTFETGAFGVALFALLSAIVLFSWQLGA